jgi:hypothetical protein
VRSEGVTGFQQAGLSVPETPRRPADLVIRGRRCSGMTDRWR